MNIKRILGISTLPAVIGIAFLKHLFIFLAYDWYAGMDSYSYDVCGLQLVSGAVFDIFPIMYRPPLAPILKNLLYLVFEGHPFALSVLLHSLGIGTVVLFYRLGCRFHKAVGFATGMLMAWHIPIALFFHSISATTFYLPLLVLAMDRFVAWVLKPTARSLVWLVITTILCVLTQSEGVFLVPLFFVFGWLSHRQLKQATVFLFVCTLLYNAVCLAYCVHFGYWAVTYKTGWSLFNRITRKADYQFDSNNGSASQRIYEYMRQWMPLDVSAAELAKNKLLTYTENDNEQQAFLAKIGVRLSLSVRQMHTFNIAQRDMGYIEADRLFRKASLEGIFLDPYKFVRSSFLRMLGHLDLWSLERLRHAEYYLNKARFSYTGKREDMEEARAQEYVRTSFWRPPPYEVPSPFPWERQAIGQRLRQAFGVRGKAPPLPESFQMQPNFIINSGTVYPYSCGDCVMTERRWNCRDLDVYFFLIYWGARWQSRTALKFLKYWDSVSMPTGAMRIWLHWGMWIVSVAGITVAQRFWHRMFLAMLLCVILLQALVQVVFSDNFGGRFALQSEMLLWLVVACGIVWIFKKWQAGSAHEGIC